MIETYHRIMNHKDNLNFPDDRFVSKDAQHLIRALLTDRSVVHEGKRKINVRDFLLEKLVWVEMVFQIFKITTFSSIRKNGRGKQFDKVKEK